MQNQGLFERNFLIWGLSLLASVTLLPASLDPAHAGPKGGEAAAEDDDFDRLDGTGLSKKRVDVIEWEGNLEIHVYPAGSLRGLALKLDKSKKDKPVMVIGYRFDNDPQSQLIRRAILGIDLKEGFKTYRDLTATDYDKIVISNNGLSSQVAKFNLDPEPKQLYPEGHPALVAKEEPSPAQQEKRAPASKPEVVDAGTADEEGTIRPFRW